MQRKSAKSVNYGKNGAAEHVCLLCPKELILRPFGRDSLKILMNQNLRDFTRRTLLDRIP